MYQMLDTDTAARFMRRFFRRCHRIDHRGNAMDAIYLLRSGRELVVTYLNTRLHVARVSARAPRMCRFCGAPAYQLRATQWPGVVQTKAGDLFRMAGEPSTCASHLGADPALTAMILRHGQLVEGDPCRGPHA